jgi:hypothetical protein
MLLDTSYKYYKTMEMLASKFDHGIITSFGVFCGILHNLDFSYKIESHDRNFLDSIKDHNDITVIVGTGTYNSPKKSGNCDDCLLAYAKRTVRIEKHREIFPNVKWKIIENLHSKVAVFWNDGNIVSIIGSRNFTGSDNMEVAIVVKDRETNLELRDYCLNLDKIAKDVDLDIIIPMMIESTKSDRCVSLLCGEI